jgi:tetratricopeptide (TPR) repeat protein
MTEVRPGNQPDGTAPKEDGNSQEERIDEQFDETLDDLDDAVFPSTKVEHDFVPGETSTKIPAAVDGEQGSSVASSTLSPCPNCGTALESWQVSCHGCGKDTAAGSVPKDVAPVPAVEQITQAFADWFNKGNAAYEKQEYSEAQNCFAEALARVKGLANAKEREIEVRKNLARSLQKLEKNSEAAEQYILLSRLMGASSQKNYAQKARDLARSTVDAMSAMNSDILYRVPTRRESKLVPLYCSHCKQLLVEAEVYAFRRGRSSNVRCFCGFEGTPAVRFDVKHIRALKDEPTLRLVRAQVLDAASDTLTGGRTRDKAIALAVLSGWCGGHKLYLGQYYFGTIYAAWFAVSWLLLLLRLSTGFDYGLLALSLVPWALSLVEAVKIARMSRVSFNLTYNIERIIARLPNEELHTEPISEVFDMDPGEALLEPDEGFEDEMSSIKLRTVAPHVVLTESYEPDASPEGAPVD